MHIVHFIVSDTFVNTIPSKAKEHTAIANLMSTRFLRLRMLLVYDASIPILILYSYWLAI